MFTLDPAPCLIGNWAVVQQLFFWLYILQVFIVTFTVCVCVCACVLAYEMTRGDQRAISRSQEVFLDLVTQFSLPRTVPFTSC